MRSCRYDAHTIKNSLQVFAAMRTHALTVRVAFHQHSQRCRCSRCCRLCQRCRPPPIGSGKSPTVTPVCEEFCCVTISGPAQPRFPLRLRAHRPHHHIQQLHVHTTLRGGTRQSRKRAAPAHRPKTPGANVRLCLSQTTSPMFTLGCRIARSAYRCICSVNSEKKTGKREAFFLEAALARHSEMHQYNTERKKNPKWLEALRKPSEKRYSLSFRQEGKQRKKRGAHSPGCLTRLLTRRITYSSERL